MMLKYLTLSIAFSIVFSLKNLRLREIEKLIERFDSTLEVNYLFYDKYRNQANNPLLCNAENGPHCSLVNNKSLLNLVNKSDVQQDNILKKALVIQDWDKMRLQQKETPDAFFVVTNKQRDLTLGMGSVADLKKEVEGLITFEEISLVEDEKKITQVLKYDESKGFIPEGAGYSRNSLLEDDTTLKVIFENLYGPNKNQVFNRKNTLDNQKSKGKDAIDLQEIEPANIYVFSKKDESGVLHFSKPVEVKQFYARKHNYIQYQEERKNRGDNTNRIEFNMIGKLGDKTVVEFKKETFTQYNKFVKLEPQSKEKSILIDTLVVSPNTDIDNILISFGQSSEEKSLSIAEWQDLLQHVSEKIEQFSYLNDEKLKKKIINEEIISFLKKKGINELQRNKIAENIVVKKVGQDIYEIHIEDPSLFTPNVGELLKDKQVKQMIEEALKDPKKNEEFQELTKDQLEELLKVFDNVQVSKDTKTVENDKKNKKNKNGDL